jgi:hypothetical protein
MVNEQAMYHFLYECKNRLEIIKEGKYTFSIRSNEKDEAQLVLWFDSGYLIIYTEFNRFCDKSFTYDHKPYFQDCDWAEEVIDCNLSEFTSEVLRCGLEQAENKLSIHLSK